MFSVLHELHEELSPVSRLLLHGNSVLFSQKDGILLQ